MDSRILDRINLLKEKEEEKLRQQREESVKLREQYKAYIESKVPEAEKWVDEFLLDAIAQSILHPFNISNRSIPITDSDDIPVLAKVQAIKNKNIQGISITEQYVPEDYDPNDESYRTMMPVHTNYYVVWSVK